MMGASRSAKSPVTSLRPMAANWQLQQPPARTAPTAAVDVGKVSATAIMGACIIIMISSRSAHGSTSTTHKVTRTGASSRPAAAAHDRR